VWNCIEYKSGLGGTNPYYPGTPLHHVHVHDNFFESKYFDDGSQGRQLSIGINGGLIGGVMQYKGFGDYFIHNNMWVAHWLDGGSLKTNEQMRIGDADLRNPANGPGVIKDNVFFRSNYGAAMLS